MRWLRIPTTTTTTAETRCAGPPAATAAADAELSTAWRESKVTAAYASKLLNDPDLYDPACRLKEIQKEFKINTTPSLHIGDNIEASIATVDPHAWVALPDTTMHGRRSRFHDAKQPNGHARMLTCTTDAKPTEIARVVPEAVAYVYINSTAPAERLLNDVIPMVMAEDGAAVVRVHNPGLELVRRALVRGSIWFESLKLCKPATSDALETEVFAVYEGFSSLRGEAPSASEEGWDDAVRHFEATRSKCLTQALDLIAYFNGVGLDTEEDCATHERQARRR